MEVWYDHGHSAPGVPGAVGKLKAWFGPKYAQGGILADMDIAVVERDSGRARALIEIEETSSKPKLLLGDVLATLLGHAVMFQGKRSLLVGTYTTLIVLAKGGGSAQDQRLSYLQGQINQLKASLDTPNAAIGQVVLDLFQDEPDLNKKLREQIASALRRAGDDY